jgi:hypothetical protein
VACSGSRLGIASMLACYRFQVLTKITRQGGNKLPTAREVEREGYNVRRAPTSRPGA